MVSGSMKFLLHGTFFLIENKKSECMKFIRCLMITFQRYKILRLLLHWQLLSCRSLVFFFLNFQLSFCSSVQCDFEKRCIFSLHGSTKIINNIEDTRQKIKGGCPVHICKMLCPHWFFIFQKHCKFVCNSNIIQFFLSDNYTYVAVMILYNQLSYSHIIKRLISNLMH